MCLCGFNVMYIALEALNKMTVQSSPERPEDSSLMNMMNVYDKVSDTVYPLII